MQRVINIEWLFNVAENPAFPDNCSKFLYRRRRYTPTVERIVLAGSLEAEEEIGYTEWRT